MGYIDHDTRRALKEVAAGNVEQYGIVELEGMGLTGVTSMAGRTDDDALMQQAQQLLDDNPDETNPAEYVTTALDSRLGDLAALQAVIDGDADQVGEETMLGLDIGAQYDDHELQTEPSEEDAERALDEFALCVESTMTFEVVLGTGGPDDRLLIECDGVEPGPHDGHGGGWEIRRIIYRYSWSGSAERVLSGEQFETAERYARRVVPELAE